MKKLSRNVAVCTMAAVMFCSGAAFAAEIPSIDAASARKNYTAALSVQPMDKSVIVKKNVVIIAPAKEDVVYTLSGYFNGQIIVKTKNTVLKLKDAYLENTAGEAAVYGESKFELSPVAGSVNYIVSSGKSKSKGGAVQCAKDIVLGGSGTLYVSGAVYHGIKGDDVKIKGSGTHYLQGTASGAALNCESLTVEPGKTFNAYFLNSKNGIKADSEIIIASGNFYLYGNGTALKTDRKKDAPAEPHGITLKGGVFHMHGNETLYVTEENACNVTGAAILEE
ncbi:MAG: carbohydrate-binding domain-containing protein [Treponema sp.]|nr:carbohydrate-binding domain-containing protein [Treponema sp.]